MGSSHYCCCHTAGHSRLSVHTGKTASLKTSMTLQRSTLVRRSDECVQQTVSQVTGGVWDVCVLKPLNVSLNGCLLAWLLIWNSQIFTLLHYSGSHQVQGKTWCLMPPLGQCWRWRWVIWAELPPTLVPDRRWLSGSSISGSLAASPQLHKHVMEHIKAARCPQLDPVQLVPALTNW